MGAHPLQLLLILFAGWVNRRQLCADRLVAHDDLAEGAQIIFT